MKKILATIGILSLLSLNMGTAFAAVTAINVGNQTGPLTTGTAGTSTYAISFTETDDSDISGFSVTGLPAGATATFSATSSDDLSPGGDNPVPPISLTINTSASTPAGTSTFTVLSTSPALSATGTLTVNATTTPLVVQPCNGSTFDTSATGTVEGKEGWRVINTDLDQAVVENTYGYTAFGCKTFRMSNASTSNIIWTQVFSPGTDDAGELTALNGSNATGTTRNRFEARFDLASVMSTEQPGMHMSVSPNRGPNVLDGTRMSTLAFSDSAAGIDVFFFDFTGTSTPTTQREVSLGTLSRTQPHTIKFLMDFVEGPSNDIVEIFIDGTSTHVGTSWENFYRFDTNSGTPTPDASRTVNSLSFYEDFASTSANFSKGFLVDNVSLSSTSTATTTATTTPPVSTSTLPIITLNGSSTMNIFLDSIFIDPGATAISGTTTVPVTATGTVNTAILGTNTIIYTATGTNNDVASTTRIVNVVSTSTPPTITLNGSSTMSITINTTFTDPGATAVDAIGSSTPVTATGTVNTAALGTYTITYTATDTNNNTATTTRTVNVVAAPVAPPAPVASGGGGGGGGSGFYPPAPGLPAGFVYAPLPGQTGGTVGTGITGGTAGNPITLGTITTSTGQVLGVTTFNFTRNLRFGSTGNDVTELQKVLIREGDLILATPTRYFGRLTQRALMKWQARKNLPATGFFGPLSRAAILR